MSKADSNPSASGTYTCRLEPPLTYSYIYYSFRIIYLDIDALFGKVWRKMRGRAVMTPQEYMRIILSTFTKLKIPVRVVDIFACADFKGLMDLYMDKRFGKFAKHDRKNGEDWTQLVFTYEACEVCEDFPTGVKVHFVFNNASIVYL